MIPTLPGSPEAPRIRVLWVTAQGLLGMLQGMDGTLDRGVLTSHGLPDDARAVGVTVDTERQTLGVIVESETFPEMLEGYAMEPLQVTFSTFTSPRLQELLAELQEAHLQEAAA